ncbi:hypothetical protein LJR161_006148 [Variovorax paradoxus]|uniref:hypothetical protein n=1 Tax=Variovorax paradoxus TaxID=34073 RepID=UPI003ECE6F0C
MSELPAGWRVIPLGTLLRGIEAGQIRAVVGPIASERVGLDGNGLKLVVQWGGERSTAAIESLKVIALDLAVMSMSMEGATRLPAFLLHDSPARGGPGAQRLPPAARRGAQAGRCVFFGFPIHRDHHDATAA